ncbi:cupin domain-containing protein [Neisseria sp.]|uniref:cupin domain-containing protein n=1 Tax=Neisseria sp. TaxID=192066 RepID=UPI0035A0D46F
MDILNRLVSLAQLRGSVDVMCRFQGNWYVRHAAGRGQGVAHVVTEGSGFMQSAEGIRQLQAGDVVFFPRSAEHILSSSATCDNSGDVPQRSRNGAFIVNESTGAEEGRLNLFCARFEYDRHADLMDSLPEMLLLDMNGSGLIHLAALLKAEAASPQHGSEAVVDALASVLLVQILRAYLDQSRVELPEGLLSGWRNPRLNPLIQDVLNAPEKTWKVEDMAARANLSRAQLMRLFKRHTGTSPHAFVNRIRLQQAALMLRQSNESVLSVALSSGFQSETHFGKAFKKYYGETPGSYRKNGRQTEETQERWIWEI